jgi:hypothetical protein
LASITSKIARLDLNFSSLTISNKSSHFDKYN